MDSILNDMKKLSLFLTEINVKHELLYEEKESIKNPYITIPLSGYGYSDDFDLVMAVGILVGRFFQSNNINTIRFDAGREFIEFRISDPLLGDEVKDC